MSIRHIALLAVILALGASPVAAQAPGLFPWWDSPIARDLGLTEEQHRQVRDTVSGSRERLFQLRRAVLSAEEELRAQMDAGQVDSARAGDAIEKVVAARSDLTRAVAQMSLKLRLALTPSQWQELQRRVPRGGGRGPGGPFGPGRRRGPEGPYPAPPPEERPPARL